MALSSLRRPLPQYPVRCLEYANSIGVNYAGFTVESSLIRGHLGDISLPRTGCIGASKDTHLFGRPHIPRTTLHLVLDPGLHLNYGPFQTMIINHIRNMFAYIGVFYG